MRYKLYFCGRKPITMIHRYEPQGKPWTQLSPQAARYLPSAFGGIVQLLISNALRYCKLSFTNKPKLITGAAALMLIFLLPLYGHCQENVKKNTVDCKVGTEYKIELSSTPSTGYIWAVGSPFDTTLLVMKSKVFVPGKDTTLPGKPGTDVFTFKAVNKGTVTVRMILKKEYSRKVDRAEDYEFLITK